MIQTAATPARGENFYYREDVSRILRRLRTGTNVRVVGPRRSGKTSILYYLADNQPDDSFIFLLVYGAAVNSPNQYFKLIYDEIWKNSKLVDLANGILDEIKIKTQALKNNNDYFEKLQILSDLLPLKGIKIVIMVDEFSWLLDNILKNSDKETTNLFIQKNRFLRQSNALVFVYCFTNGFDDTIAVKQFDSAHFNDLSTVSISPLLEIRNITAKEKIDVSISIVQLSITSFKIKDFRGITATEIVNIPPKTQWLFLTGENGFGKTSILQALAKGLTGGGYLDLKTDKDKSISQKIVAYGSSRLQVSAGTSTEVVSKYSAIDSLLSNETPLINIEERLKDWDRNYEKGFLQLETLFKALLPRLGRVAVKFNEATKSSEVKYYETDDEGLFYGDGVTFEQLAAGYKNIIAMVGDLVYRLSLNQDVKSLSDLSGIVLIDEIELHLHAKYQKIFIEKLTELFPKIQFIVSTHSPISLLGAPKNAAIINVSRTHENGIEAELLDIDFSTLTPNAILSSPIFGFQSIVPVSKSPNKMVRTEDNFKDIGLNDNLKQNINDFLSTDKQQELLNLINAK